MISEGKGSLLFFLKSEGWVTSLSAGVDYEGMGCSTIAYIFTMSISFTSSGLGKKFDIISFVYQYLKLLRKDPPQEWIFKELQDIESMEFRYADDQLQEIYAEELAVNLLLYPPEHVIYGPYAYEVWDEELVKYLLSFLKPKNMRVDILTTAFKKLHGIQLEPWYGSSYTEEDIPLSLMELWEDPPEIDSSLHLPSRNSFIPSDFSIRADMASCQSTDASTLRCIRDEPNMKLWYKLDKTFKLPRASAYFRITLKEGNRNMMNALLTQLYVLLLTDELEEIFIQAGVARLRSSIFLGADTLELKLYGFNDKLSVLLSKILATMNSFSPKDDRFRAIKASTIEDLRSTIREPKDRCSYLRHQTLYQCFWDVKDMSSLLEDLSLADLKAFIPNLLSQLYIEGLCHGNLLKDEALQLADMFRSNLSIQPLPPEFRHKVCVMSLPSSADLVRDVKVENRLETISAVELYFQIEPEEGTEMIKFKALIDLFEDIVEEPLYNQLRTKEQLGFLVESGTCATYRILGYCFFVQATQYSPVYLQGRIDNFINGLEELLNGLEQESFENYKSCLAGKLLEKVPYLSLESDNFWEQIINKRYMFDLQEKEVQELAGIQKSDIIDWYHTYFRQSSPKCRRLATRIWGCNTDMEDAKSQLASGQVIIQDLPNFKELATFYPSLC